MAAVGAKGAGSLPPLPVTGATGVTITVSQPGSTSAAGSNGVVADGSEIDRIAADGTPQRLMTLKDDVVYGLSLHGGQVLAVTGNRGRLYSFDPADVGRLTLLGRVEAGQATSIAEVGDALFVGTSNSGSVARLESKGEPATYTSEVFDAGQSAKWGRAEVEADQRRYELLLRTGNVPNTAFGWSDWQTLDPRSQAALPASRYAQFKVKLQPGTSVAAVTLNYLPRNVAPVVDEVLIVSGARMPVPPPTLSQATVQVAFPTGSASPPISLVSPDSNTAPLTAQKDRTGIVARWSAHDDNGDDLMFSVWYRGVGETSWRLLKDAISERYLSFDAALLQDGRYEMKVVASDAPVHTDGEALTGERSSSSFVIDTTPPVPGSLSARLEGSKMHWSLEATDATSPIAHAEYSIDAGPWQYVEPVGGLSDSRAEHYDTVSEIMTGSAKPPSTQARSVEHVLAVRIYDRAENMSSVKTVVR